MTNTPDIISTNTPDIISFDGDYEFLSNFYPSPILHVGLHYPTVEHAFQAYKTLDPELRSRICACLSPGYAKQAGRRLALRPDWEAVKYVAMEWFLRQKFGNHMLAELLVATGAARLIEGNTWGDRIWGQVNGEGENHLGEMLMKIRSEI